MVMLTAAEPVRVYRVLDRTGQAIGEVVEPRSRPELGPGAGTVLLLRPSVFSSTRHPAPSAGPQAAPGAGRSL
jgi:hypothetical protein